MLRKGKAVSMFLESGDNGACAYGLQFSGEEVAESAGEGKRDNTRSEEKANEEIAKHCDQTNIRIILVFFFYSFHTLFSR